MFFRKSERLQNVEIRIEGNYLKELKNRFHRDENSGRKFGEYLKIFASFFFLLILSRKHVFLTIEKN